MRHVDHGLDQLRTIATLVHLGNEALVDLQQGDRQTGQVHERREPGAEVVQGEAHAQFAERIHGQAHLIAAAHHRGFGQLELQPVPVHATLVDQALQGR